MAGHSEFPVPVDDPTWRIEVNGFDPEREAQVESWLTVGNGRTGTRGSLEEDNPASSPALYVAGIFGCAEGEQCVPELIRGPEWTSLTLRVGDQVVALDRGRVLSHRRTLDMRQGLVVREWRHLLPSGDEWHLRTARFASLADRRLLVLTAQARTNAGEVALVTGVPIPETQATVDGIDHAQVRDGAELVSVRGRRGREACFAITTVDGADGVERYVAVERATGDRGCAEPAEEAVRQARATGVGALWDRHRRAWRQRWQESDVVLAGDETAQKALRFSMYHLISAGDPESDLASIGARGMSGPGYLGHVFWDTDVFILPFFIWTHPPTARALLAYRYRTLPAARAKAHSMGYRGALYPWESADTGEECTPQYVMLPNGVRLDVLTGAQEHHISADVAWAAWEYWRITGDDEFMESMGAEILLETARFWVSRAEVGDDGRHHIRGVIGPDEYHEGVDDNAFTNVMARWNIRAALGLKDSLGSWLELSDRLGFDSTELDGWEQVATNLVDGFDPDSLVYEQFAGFHQLENLKAAELAARPFTGEIIVGVDHLRNTQVVKQADVLMLARTLGHEMPKEVMAANYRHYEPRTCHGSSLSPAVHALVAARMGLMADASDYFAMASAIDFDDRMGNAAKGVHVATMGGLWQAAVLGFGGLSAKGDTLEVDPHPMPGWDSLAFPVQWRGAHVHIEITENELNIEIDREVKLAVGSNPPAARGPGRFTARRQGDKESWSDVEGVGE